MKLKTLLFIILMISLGIILLQANSNTAKEFEKEKIITENERINNENDKTGKNENINEKNNEQNHKKEETKFKCPIGDKDYEDMSLLNIGQKSGLIDIMYIPKNLEEIDIAFSTKKNLCLTKETKDSFEEMAQNAKMDKIEIKVSSAFRDYNYQSILFQNASKNNEGNSISVAKPGYSEHQLGTAIDITGSSINYLSASDLFNNTKEDIWLKENAYLYGFVQSYPLGKEKITLYKYEPWHYRYIGKEKALELKKLDLTIKEYLAQ